jgi:hypothetical protein
MERQAEPSIHSRQQSPITQQAMPCYALNIIKVALLKCTIFRIQFLPYQDQSQSSKISVGRYLRILHPLQVLSLNQTLDSSLHHVQVWVEALSQLRDDFGEEVLVAELLSGSVLR